MFTMLFQISWMKIIFKVRCLLLRQANFVLSMDFIPSHLSWVHLLSVAQFQSSALSGCSSKPTQSGWLELANWPEVHLEWRTGYEIHTLESKIYLMLNLLCSCTFILQFLCWCDWKSPHTNSLEIHLCDLNTTFLSLKVSNFHRFLQYYWKFVAL